jgi:hypothetical protein
MYGLKIVGAAEAFDCLVWAFFDPPPFGGSGRTNEPLTIVVSSARERGSPKRSGAFEKSGYHTGGTLDKR